VAPPWPEQLTPARPRTRVNYASGKQGADSVVADIADRGGKGIAIQGDVSKQADITRLFSEAEKVLGWLDILVNDAGLYGMAPLEELTEDSFQWYFNLNVLGLLLATKEAVKPEGGSIINIGSGASSLRPANSTVYMATKAAVDAITGVIGRHRWQGGGASPRPLSGRMRTHRAHQGPSTPSGHVRPSRSSSSLITTITKPLSVRELEARVRAVIDERDRIGEVAGEAARNGPTWLCFATFALSGPYRRPQ